VRVVVTPKKTRIEIIPLIDVIFLLLVFFIYAMLSMTVHHGLPVDIPASDRAVVENSDLPSITVKDDGSVFLDSEQISVHDLGRLLAVRIQKSHGKGVLLFADRNLPYHKLFEVIEEITSGGVSSISLQSREEETN